MSSFAQPNKNYLLRFPSGESYEFGDPAGYINQKGDTIVPVGQYTFCYSDTITNFGFVLDKNGTCKAINNKGKYLYDVKFYDNGPDYISDGLFRIVLNGKTGYANEQGKIVTKPQFSCAEAFENSKAKVTYNCELIQDGEYKLMKSDTWFFINKKGKKVAK